MTTLFQYRNYRVASRLDEDATYRLFDAIVDGTMSRGTVFRDNWRTLSTRFSFEEKAVLLKVPRARNQRLWERFLTLFRSSDAFRAYRHLELMSSMGFCAPEPVLAAERRVRGFVVDSFVCYRFVDGRSAVAGDASIIVSALKSLHGQGYLRSDAQLANFLILDGEVVFIDFRLKKPRLLPALQKAREMDRFRRSCPQARDFLSQSERHSYWARMASCLESASFWLRVVKRKAKARRPGKS